MEETRTEIQSTGPSKKESAEALAEVLACARQALAKLRNARSAADNDQEKIRKLTHENEFLKNELSGLYKLIKEKL